MVTVLGRHGIESAERAGEMQAEGGRDELGRDES